VSRIDGELAALRAQLHGILLRPGDVGYDAARAVFNAMIDRRPRVIIRCASASDVIRGVGFAREHHLALSVRGGGHSVAGNAVCDDGIMLDLSEMKAVRVDPQLRTARAGPGLTLGELDHETQTWGLATPLGVMSKTGIAGLTLGGGLGWLNGTHGLTCDNVLAVELVTADGQLLTANENENDDLFWAIRGGGGNFGVVTSFRYRLHPVGPVLAGGLSYSFHDAAKVLPFYDQFADSAPDALSTAASLACDPSGQPTITIMVCYCGPIHAGEIALHHLRSFHPPLQDSIQPTPYWAFQRASDTAFPTGRRHYWKSGFLLHLTDEAIETMMRFIPHMPSATSGVGLQHMHGAATRIDPAATAFAHRADQYDFLIASQWSDQAHSARNIEWTRAFFDAMQPHLEPSVYVNNLCDEADARVRAAFGGNYQRLAELKAACDPDNLFRSNHNIKPTAVAPNPDPNRGARTGRVADPSGDVTTTRPASTDGPVLPDTARQEHPDMPDPHPNVLTYLAAMAAFNHHDLTAVAELVHPDFVYRIPGGSSIAGEFHGIDGFVEALTRLRDESDGTLELTPLAVLADDDNLLARARITATRAGQQLDTENCYAFRFVNGKVAEGQVFLSDPEQVDNFWATPPRSEVDETTRSR
jgi:FAD/FMN-containing dehydrogenase/ketosteroid isomerase-like protein